METNYNMQPQCSKKGKYKLVEAKDNAFQVHKVQDPKENALISDKDAPICDLIKK